MTAAALEQIVGPAVERQLAAAVAATAAAAADPAAAAAAAAQERLGSALLPRERALIGLLQGITRLLDIHPNACSPRAATLLQQLLQHTFAVAALEGCYFSAAASCGSTFSSSSSSSSAAVCFLHNTAPEGIAASSHVVVRV